MLQILLLAPSLLSAAPAPVTLHFAWPAKLSGSVKHAYQTQNDAKLPQFNAEVTYRFTVQDVEKEKGLRKVVPSDVKLPDMMSAMTVGEPSVVRFDERGAFKGIEHQPGDVFDRMVENNPLPLPPEKKAQLRVQMETMLNADAKEKWDELTGRWDGVTLTPGKPSKRTVKLRLGSMMGAFSPEGQPEVESTEVTGIETGVACEPAAPEKACVRLTVETAPSKPLPAKPDVMGMVEKKVTKRVVIVLEPATLVPYSIHLERADLLERDGKTERHLQIDDQTFSYGAPGAKKL
jgi:hypothetical protein